MLKLPFFEELETARNILIAGAGGGFDVFCGLPLYLGLEAMGKQVHLGSLSFSRLPPPKITKEARQSPTLLTVTADTPLVTEYFPEKYLAQWFREQGAEVPVHCFECTGVKPLLASYSVLVEQLAVDTVILVDGGTDSLMRGDEAGLGTPHEDMASIAAVNGLAVERKFLVCLGLGVDSFHGCCTAHFLEGVSELIRSQGYLGMFSLQEEMPEVQKFWQATEAVFKKMPRDISIVCSSILSALAGHYGDYHVTRRTRNSPLWINPLMSAYWCFRLEAVARRVLYLEGLKDTETRYDISCAITNFQSRCARIRARQQIPM